MKRDKEPTLATLRGGEAAVATENTNAMTASSTTRSPSQPTENGAPAVEPQAAPAFTPASVNDAVESTSDRKAQLEELRERMNQLSGGGESITLEKLTLACAEPGDVKTLEGLVATGSKDLVSSMVSLLARNNREKIEERREKIEERRKKLEALSELQQYKSLSPSLVARKSKQNLVLSPSAVSKDPDLRREFRENQVAEEPCRGGFIAQKFYLDFVLAAREFDGHKLPAAKKQHVVQEVAKLGNILSRSARVDHSLFNKGYLDEEAPQSAVGSELFRLALDLLRPDSSKDTPGLHITHQQHLVTNIKTKDGSPPDFNIIKKQKKKRTRDAAGAPKETEEEKKAKEPEEEEKALDQIDICAWFVHPNESIGACVLGACEYKPGNTEQEEREAQADMYGSNILILHKKQCIVIDIAGANELENWAISAHGLVEAEFSSEPHSWEKTPLYSGKGAEAIVLVSQGLLRAKESFPGSLNQYGHRLGPVVGVIDDHVYKAYDNAKVRKTNIQVVQELFDENAELLSSEDRKLYIIRMQLRASDWTSGDVSSKAFRLIIEKLWALHKTYGPHGDIRLANLLSSGYILDFDFVGTAAYPPTLQKLDQDGKRHPEVERMIEKAKQNLLGFEPLKPNTTHDWYSLAEVMRLFSPLDDANKEGWEAVFAGHWPHTGQGTACVQNEYYQETETVSISTAGGSVQGEFPSVFEGPLEHAWNASLMSLVSIHLFALLGFEIHTHLFVVFISRDDFRVIQPFNLFPGQIIALILVVSNRRLDGEERSL